MSEFLIDNTREYLIEGAEHAVLLEHGDRRIQILARREHVLVRACEGGAHKTWLEKPVGWEDLARAKTNPLPGVIDGILFRLDRQIAGIAGKPESGQ